MITNFKLFEKIIYHDIDLATLKINNNFLQKIANFFGYEKSDIIFLDSGSYGNAYLITPENKVLKITSDRSEYHNAMRLKNINSKYIVNYYDARIVYTKGEIINIEDDEYNIDDFDYDAPLDTFNLNGDVYFALIMDFVDPLSENEKEIIRIIDRRINIPSEYYKGATEGWIKTVSDYFKLNQNSGLTEIYGYENIMNIVNDIVNILKECKKYGIIANDIHTGNLGVIYDEKQKRDILVLFDIGTAHDIKFQKIKKLKNIV